ncbi:hypothetical protein I8751_22275 [Nostocaceae cyanobacterium CENA357]|uniref:Uncharacterized protein n=1 Tax=Atlanticothrix silvestris CENA357 TaxID=1725252 RepID=A0A8J7L7E3_9CYAN|nr:hypothetical protein [Atlanticothrix silvestris]MBH8555022.1 hypothetical protein [Atlanticothrix silvestris CENA357]
MATIKIDNLSVTGSELFSDSESYLDQITEVSESDSLRIKGGTTWTIVTVTLLLRSDSQQQ